MNATVLPPPRSSESIVESLAGGGDAVVALSGGVDSSVVALLAFRALGSRATAVTLTGVAVSRSERERASEVARRIGIAHLFVEVDPLAVEEYASNPVNRCYHCRAVETHALLEWGSAHGTRQYLDGLHVDDQGDDRPGIRAMDEAGFRHPLLEASWGKSDVRAFARAHDLPNWNAPSDACLASRVAHGDRITVEGLRQIEEAEERVRSEGFGRVRVRVRGSAARVEVDPSEVARLTSEPLASRIRVELARLGFSEVTLDLVGYRPRAGA